jgi:hypothetical protein
MSAAASPTLFTPAQPATRAHVSSRTAPWYIWAGVLAITSAAVGGAWDVSWHRSIGRDSFWTPAHMAIYLCGVLAGVVGLYLTFQATTGRDPELRASSVSIFGLRAPLGVFLAGWGGIAMLTSAPFDNWWHNAYGLDVKIVSPPHALLILGIRCISIGVLFLILAAMNRAAAASAVSFKQLQILFLYVAGFAVEGQMFFVQEFTSRSRLHVALPYIVLAGALPVLFTLFYEASRFRWACTATAAVYTIFIIGEILILPLFPAQPKLGPVFFPVTHMVPAEFPVLILAPSFALDLLLQRTKSWRSWQIALAVGLVFTAVLVAVEWPFAKFLVSSASENRFFGTMYFDYGTGPLSSERLRIFFHTQTGAPLVEGLLKACLYGAISAWIGLGLGRWMRGVQR